MQDDMYVITKTSYITHRPYTDLEPRGFARGRVSSQQASIKSTTRIKIPITVNNIGIVCITHKRPVRTWRHHTSKLKFQNSILVQSVCKYFFSFFKIFLFRYQIFKSYFFVINFSYFIIRFLLNSSIVKSDNEIGKVNDKKI